MIEAIEALITALATQAGNAADAGEVEKSVELTKAMNSATVSLNNVEIVLGMRQMERRDPAAGNGMAH